MATAGCDYETPLIESNKIILFLKPQQDDSRQLQDQNAVSKAGSLPLDLRVHQHLARWTLHVHSRASRAGQTQLASNILQYHRLPGVQAALLTKSGTNPASPLPGPEHAGLRHRIHGAASSTPQSVPQRGKHVSCFWRCLAQVQAQQPSIDNVERSPRSSKVLPALTGIWLLCLLSSDR